ncbi:MAG: DUF5050 domain-containing protein [Bacteroidales bacterium]|nr:DUF5050 domain-containing protein [Bacteroidales bacterium]
MKLKLTFAVLIMGLSFVFADDNCHNFWPVLSPDGNTLYFSSTRDGDHYEIYKVAVDGTSDLMRLTFSEGNKLYPAVSPDGTKIVFQQGNYGQEAEIYIMNNDGSGLVRLTDNNRHDGFPNFSPDGNTIIFEGWDDSDYPEIFTMNVDGTNRIQITNEPGATWQSAPLYNPDGSKIYYSAAFNADNHYVMMNPDGSDPVNITEPNTFGNSDWALHFHPEGLKIIFFTTQWKGYNNGCDLIIADPDGSNWNKITEAADGEYYYGGVFHPSNGKIYYANNSGTGGTYAIYKMEIDGNEKEKISDCVPFGIGEETNPSVNVYPNPAKDWLYIDYPSDITVKIYTPEGKIIRTNHGKQVEVRSLTPGLYFAVIKPEDHSRCIIQPFLKK